MNNKRKHKSSGFTLIEVILAFLILAITTTTVYAALTQMIRTKKLVEKNQDVVASANTILYRLNRELQLAYSGSGLIPPPDNSWGQIGLGTQFRGINEAMDREFPTDSVTFVALEGGQYLPDGQSRGGLVQLTYSLVADEEAEKTQFSLVREEVPYLQSPDEAYKQALRFPIATKVRGFQLKYWHPELGWLDEWLPQPGKQLSGIPKIVAISIIFEDQEGHVRKFSSAAAPRSRS